MERESRQRAASSRPPARRRSRAEACDRAAPPGEQRGRPAGPSPRLRVAPPLPVAVPRAPFLVLVLVRRVAGVLGILVLNTKINENAFRLDALQQNQQSSTATKKQHAPAARRVESPGNLAAAARGSAWCRRTPGVHPAAGRQGARRSPAGLRPAERQRHRSGRHQRCGGHRSATGLTGATPLVRSPPGSRGGGTDSSLDPTVTPLRGNTDRDGRGRPGIGDARRYTPRGRTVREADAQRGRGGDPFRPALQVVRGGDGADEPVRRTSRHTRTAYRRG